MFSEHRASPALPVSRHRSRKSGENRRFVGDDRDFRELEWIRL
jgi:hypothetical protein